MDEGPVLKGKVVKFGWLEGVLVSFKKMTKTLNVLIKNILNKSFIKIKDVILLVWEVFGNNFLLFMHFFVLRCDAC